MGRSEYPAPFDPSFWSDPYRFYPALRARPPLRLPLLIPTVVVARHRDALAVLGDAGRFSSCVPDLPFIPGLDPFGGAATMLFSDPPQHTRLRRVAARYFRASALEELAALVRATTETLLDRIAATREFDGVGDLATPLPAAITAHVLGIPIEDEPRLRAWSDAAFASVRHMLAIAGGAATDGDVAARVAASIPPSNGDALVALREYFARAIARREARPEADLLSASLPAVRAGEVTRDELVGLALLILFAGTDTTTNLIGNGLLALATHEEARARLRVDPTLIPSAVEEVLRWDSPVQTVMRYPRVDARVGGTDVPAGGAVVVLLGAANRDPEVFRRADHFDVARRPNPHLGLGDGIHACIGGQLARIQGQVALARILTRFPALRMRDPAAPLAYRASLLSRGLSSLPMVC